MVYLFDEKLYHHLNHTLQDFLEKEEIVYNITLMEKWKKYTTLSMIPILYFKSRYEENKPKY